MEAEPKQEYIPHKKENGMISYLGVELEKGEGGLLAPDIKRFENDVLTNFDLELMQKIAIGLETKQPTLLEGGSGIGKTRTVDRMCGELNREFYIANCHKMKVEDLIGSMSTKEDTKSGLGWQDGVITQAVRNGGILFLDEYNFMPGETRGGIHQIFDALLQSKTHITLPENHNEQVPVHADFRIIAAQNPPGGEYGDREVLDPAQIDRFFTIKLPEELPDEIREARLLGSMGIDNEITVKNETYIFPGEKLSDEALYDIPGMSEILQKYLEVTKHIREALKKGELGSRDYQPVSFATTRDDQRVMGFIKTFYNGDINETMQHALELYYTNKLSEEDDREKIRTLLERVRFAKKENVKRRDLEDTQTKEASESIEGDTSSLGQAIEILGTENIISPEDVENTFNIKVEIPPIPLSREDLEKAKELGQQLILYIDYKDDGTPFTVSEMKDILDNKTSDDKKFLYSESHIDDEVLKEQIPRLGWRLTTPEIIPNSTDKNYLEQTEVLKAYLIQEVYKDQELPREYEEAVDEFNKQKDEIEELMNSDWQEAAKRLSNLQINQLFREQSSEIIYRMAINEKKSGIKNLEAIYSWSNSLASDGRLALVGDFDSLGVDVLGCKPGPSDDDIGICFSRSGL